MPYLTKHSVQPWLRRAPFWLPACKWARHHASLPHRYFMHSSQQSYEVEIVVQVQKCRTRGACGLGQAMHVWSGGGGRVSEKDPLLIGGDWAKRGYFFVGEVWFPLAGDLVKPPKGLEASTLRQGHMRQTRWTHSGLWDVYGMESFRESTAEQVEISVLCAKNKSIEKMIWCKPMNKKREREPGDSSAPICFYYYCCC